jgi:hypothetical protein
MQEPVLLAQVVAERQLQDDAAGRDLDRLRPEDLHEGLPPEAGADVVGIDGHPRHPAGRTTG